MGKLKDYSHLLGINNARYKTGLKCKGVTSSLYASWQNMKARCSNPNHPKYARYGGRGIKVCDEWQNIKGFHDWAMANGWQQGLQIDRIDNDGNYEPSNCEWVNRSSNSRKKSTTKITFEQAQEIRKRIAMGENEYHLATEYGVVHGTIWFIKNNFTHVADGECAEALKARNERNAKVS